MKKSQRDQVTEPETATPAGQLGLLVEIKSLMRKIYTASKIMVVAAMILVVVVAALQLQVSDRNNDITSTKITAEEARTAAREAKQAVEDAVAQSQNGSFDQEKFLAAFNAMVRVEEYICGGPCPVDEGTEGTNN